MSRLRGQPSANVAVPQGDLYPSGVPLVAANPNVQSTCRPAGWLFRKSPGFAGVRPGDNRYQDGMRGLGIGFTPMRFAEDISAQGQPGGVPAILDQDKIPADIADIPGSDMLTSDGFLDPDYVADNRGPYHGRGNDMPTDTTGGHRNVHGVADMGDRSMARPLTSSYWFGYVKNPVKVFRSDWHDSPLAALALAGIGITVAYVVGRDFERIWARHRSNSPVRPLSHDVVDKPVKTVATAPTAVVETAVHEVKEVANTAAEVVQDTANAAEKAVKDVTDEVT